MSQVRLCEIMLSQVEGIPALWTISGVSRGFWCEVVGERHLIRVFLSRFYIESWCE